MTNGDWIRSLDDDELALFLYQPNGRKYKCDACKYYEPFCSDEGCARAMRDWIKLEREHND